MRKLETVICIVQVVIMANLQKLARAEDIRNKNLLDNWDFRNKERIVNQRGSDEYDFPGTAYTIDRWYTNTITKLSLNSGYIRLGFAGLGTQNAFLRTKMEFGLPQKGFATLTVKLKGIGRGIITMMDKEDITIAQSDYTASDNWQYVIFTVNLESINEVSGVAVRLNNPKSDSTSTDYIDIESIKLELGEVSTLANDPPQNYAEELAKCQRYQFAFTGIANRIRNSYISTANIDFPIPVTQTLKKTPEIKNIIGELEIVSGTGSTTKIEGFAFSIISMSDSFITVRATKSGHGLTEALLQRSSDSAIILFDANL